MSELHAILSLDEQPTETTRPDATKVVNGDPIHTTWLIEDRAPLYAGIWRSTPGKWRVQYDEWEYFNVLSGLGVLTDSNGLETALLPGSRHIIRPGFAGTFEVTETLTKDFVIVA